MSSEAPSTALSVVAPVSVDRDGRPLRGDDGLLSGRRRVWLRLRRDRAALLSGSFLLVVAIIAALAPLVAPYDALKQDLRHAFEGPSTTHWLGTDNLGRDTFSRMIAASRVALLGAGQAVGIAAAIGVPVGLMIGYVGGWCDRVAMRVVDAIIAIPGLVQAMVIVAILGPSLTNAMWAVGIAFSTSFLRLTRGVVLGIKEELFVEAADVVGVPRRRIISRHILPNAVAPLLTQVTLAFGLALLAEASLSFLGLGVQPPDASWGSMLATSSRFVTRQPFLMLAPGTAIMVSVLAFNLLGDGLRDALVRTNSGGPQTRSRSRPSKLVPARPADVESRRIPAGDDGQALVVDDLTVQHTDPRGDVVTLVEGVSFSIAPGATLAIVGESGCGKTLTGLAIMGLLPPQVSIERGHVWLDDVDLAHSDLAVLQRLRGRSISMIFQEPMASLNPAFTVGQQIAAPLRHHLGLSRRAASSRAIELLARVGIADPAVRARDYPHQFSGGMAQRVMIAMAIACEPKVLIADEPTTALDVMVQAQILDLLADIQDELGMALLLVTHDLGVVADACDRTMMMYAGQIVEQGTTPESFGDPRHPYTAALLRSNPRNERRTQRLTEISGTVPPPRSWGTGCRFRPRCPHATTVCDGPVELIDLGGGRATRCVRHYELELGTAR